MNGNKFFEPQNNSCVYVYIYVYTYLSGPTQKTPARSISSVFFLYGPVLLAKFA